MKNPEILNNFTLDKNNDAIELRTEIFKLVSQYAKISHKKNDFVPHKTIVPTSGKVYDENELLMLCASSLDFWLTAGRFNTEFESKLSDYLNMNFVLTTNSGSSANLLALTALTSEQLGKKALRPGDEVITAAAGFPTTINPILQNNLIPVFIDVDIPTYVPSPKQIESAISKKTKAIILAHTLGNPFDIEQTMEIAKKHDLWVIEDCCDALGSLYNNKAVGSFGDLATFSFYPAHQITMGEGGCVVTNNIDLKRIVESFRDWGRDCFCAPGKNNTCGKRFEWKLGELPEGYDHKFTYSHVGYNLKITDMQSSIGVAQLEKINDFNKIRKNNFDYLKQHLISFSDFFIFPESLENSRPSWFGFPITVRENAPFTRKEIVEYLSKQLIDSRSMFGGNITKQPYFQNQEYRISGNLSNTDTIMNQTFWIGVFPGINQKMLDYMCNSFKNFIGNISK